MKKRVPMSQFFETDSFSDFKIQAIKGINKDLT